MRHALLLALLPILLAVACAPVGTRELHDVALFDPNGALRYRYAYGSADTLPLDGRDLALGRVVGDAAESTAYAVAGARTVGESPFLRDEVEPTVAPPVEVARIPLTTDLQVTTQRPVARAYYFDGARWFELPRDLPAGVTRAVVPVPVTRPLRGAASLTPAEADALAAGLGARGQPLILATLADDALPGDDPHPFAASAPQGLDEYRHSAFWLQPRLTTDASAYRAPPERLIYDVVAQGGQGAAPPRDTFVVLSDEDELRSFWNAVQANALTPPPPPELRFDRETILGVRLAQRPTGGYGIEVAGVERDGDELFVDVLLREPAEDAIVTQALTQPWAIVRVLGVEANVVWFRDPAGGGLFAVARDDATPF
jgi:hypothetical protein